MAIFRYREGESVSWFNEKLKLSNQRCLYCHRFLGDGLVPSNREHLIGKSLVPDRSFASPDAFNFIFRACVECNTSKSRLEGHVSSVTLFSSPARAIDASVDALAARKASKEFYPGGSGKLVQDASVSIEGNFDLGPATMKADLSAPPQLVDAMAKELALRQIQGLFSLVSSPEPRTTEGTRLLHPDNFWYLDWFLRGDWGNPTLVALMQRIQSWPYNILLNTANGYFRAALRPSDGDTGEWFWALEWNHSVRVVGGIGSSEKQPSVFHALPTPVGIHVENLRVRHDTPLPDEADTLFMPPSS